MSGLLRVSGKMVKSLIGASGRLASDAESKLANVGGWLRHILGRGGTSVDAHRSSLNSSELQWIDRNTLPKGHAFESHAGQVFRVPLKQLSSHEKGDVLLLLQPVGPENLMVLACVSDALAPDQVVLALDRKFKEVRGVTFGFVSKPCSKFSAEDADMNITESMARDAANRRAEESLRIIAAKAKWFDYRNPAGSTPAAVGSAESVTRPHLATAIRNKLEHDTSLTPEHRKMLDGWGISVQSTNSFPHDWPQPADAVLYQNQDAFHQVVLDVLRDADPLVWCFSSAEDRLPLPSLNQSFRSPG